MRGRAAVVVAALVAACSAGGAEVGVDADPTPAASCVRPGEVGNNLGVGQYCTPAGNECGGFDLAPLCLGAVGQDQWFCSRIGCDATTDCGDGAGCLIDPRGSACVPCRCDASGVGCP